MKVMVIGVQHSRGVSKAGQSYDFAKLDYGVPVRPVSSEKRQVRGFGFEVQQVSIDPSCIPQFEKIRLPAEVELLVSPDPANLQRNIVTGIKA